MLREVSLAVSPPHSLATTLRDWEQIIFRLAEPLSAPTPLPV
jgi:hypothetical protein